MIAVSHPTPHVIDNEEPLDPAPLPYTPWRALDRNVPDAIDDLLTGIYQRSRQGGTGPKIPDGVLVS